jgi:hypothetical protein
LTMDDVVLRLAVVAAVAVVAGVVSLRRRNRRQPPTQPRGEVPAQLDRVDFDGVDFDRVDVDVPGARAPWLVVVFTSSTCDTCADVWRKAQVLASRDVAVHEVEYSRDRELHDRYRIDAVPALVIADADGVVRYGRLGPVSATDLWAAMARCRDPQLPATSCEAPSQQARQQPQ